MSLAQDVLDLFGIHLTSDQVEQFSIYESELLRWNEHTNLTAITDLAEARVRHFLDSLSIVKVHPDLTGMHVIDLGSGAGFPGLPLAIVFPDAHITVMDSTGKKVAFMQHIIDMLGLKNTQAFQARAEEAGQNPVHRARYDVVLARAVARLPALLEYMLPLARVGGVCIAMKGTSAEEEAQSAKRALDLLGGVLDRIEGVSLPDVDNQHNLVVVKKMANTPKNYPRRSGIPTRQPI